jgi:adenylate cyclase
MPKRKRNRLPRRRLLAVMFTDIQGFSELAGRDEDAAIGLLRTHNRLMRAAIRSHRGVVIKTMGDAFLGRFAAASDAIDCAADVQRRLARWNKGRESRERLEIRVGVHVGDVIVGRRDILGVVANLAKRLEAQAPAGEVCCSDAARLMILHLPRYRFRVLGRSTPKGSNRRMTLYVVTLDEGAEE